MISPIIFRRSRIASEIPGAILGSAIVGCIGGPIIGTLASWILAIPFTLSVERVLRSSAIGAIAWVATYVFAGMPWIWLRKPSSRMARPLATLFGLAVSGVGGSLAALTTMLVAEAVLRSRIVTPGWMARLMVLQAVLMMIIGTFMGAYHMLAMKSELRERKLTEAAALAQTYALQAQIAPHFFFNTLNSISALIATDPEAATRMVQRLADMFRYTFAAGRVPMVPLSREIEFIHEYLSIEKIRYRERLAFELPEKEGLDQWILPCLTLQPIVENAIRHGIAKRLEGGSLRVEVEEFATTLNIRILNQCDDEACPPELNSNVVFRPGHSLVNTRERLRLAFGDGASLDFCRPASDWVCATLAIPQKETIDARAAGG